MKSYWSLFRCSSGCYLFPLAWRLPLSTFTDCNKYEGSIIECFVDGFVLHSGEMIPRESVLSRSAFIATPLIANAWTMWSSFLFSPVLMSNARSRRWVISGISCVFSDRCIFQDL